MNKLKLISAALMVMTGIVLTDAQVRSTRTSGNDVSTGVSSARSGSTVQNGRSNSSTPQNSSPRTTPVRSAGSSSSSAGNGVSGTKARTPEVRPNNSSGIRVTPGVRNNGNTAGTVTPVRGNSGVRNSNPSGTASNTTRGIRSGNSGNNAAPVRNGNSIGNGRNTIRVDNRPKEQSFDRKAVRYEGGGSSARPIYLDNTRTPLTRVNYHNKPYYMHDGYYYKKHNHGYMRIAAPIGFWMGSLPMGYMTIYVGGSPFYYFNGTYYNWHANRYYVVQPPIGAIIMGLPLNYSTIYINGIMYYEYFGTVYSPTLYYGSPAFQVVGFLN